MIAWILFGFVAIGFGSMALWIFWRLYGISRWEKFRQEWQDSQYSE